MSKLSNKTKVKVEDVVCKLAIKSGYTTKALTEKYLENKEDKSLEDINKTIVEFKEEITTYMYDSIIEKINNGESEVEALEKTLEEFMDEDLRREYDKRVQSIKLRDNSIKNYIAIITIVTTLVNIFLQSEINSEAILFVYLQLLSIGYVLGLALYWFNPDNELFRLISFKIGRTKKSVILLLLLGLVLAIPLYSIVITELSGYAGYTYEHAALDATMLHVFIGSIVIIVFCITEVINYYKSINEIGFNTISNPARRYSYYIITAVLVVVSIFSMYVYFSDKEYVFSIVSYDGETKLEFGIFNASHYSIDRFAENIFFEVRDREEFVDDKILTHKNYQYYYTSNLSTNYVFLDNGYYYMIKYMHKQDIFIMENMTGYISVGDDSFVFPFVSDISVFDSIDPSLSVFYSWDNDDYYNSMQDVIDYYSEINDELYYIDDDTIYFKSCNYSIVQWTWSTSNGNTSFEYETNTIFSEDYPISLYFDADGIYISYTSSVE